MRRDRRRDRRAERQEGRETGGTGEQRDRRAERQESRETGGQRDRRAERQEGRESGEHRDGTSPHVIQGNKLLIMLASATICLNCDFRDEKVSFEEQLRHIMK